MVSSERGARPRAEDDSEEEGALPVGWQAKQTEKGRTYYVNHNDKTTHWRLPQKKQQHKKKQKKEKKEKKKSKKSEKSAPSSSAAAGAAVEAAVVVVNADEARGSSMADAAPEQASTADAAHGQTSSAAAARDQACSSMVADFLAAAGDLPVGWEVKLTEGSRPFLIDHNTKSTHWSYQQQRKRKPEALPIGWQQLVGPADRPYYWNAATGATSWERPVVAAASSSTTVAATLASPTRPKVKCPSQNWKVYGEEQKRRSALVLLPFSSEIDRRKEKKKVTDLLSETRNSPFNSLGQRGRWDS